MDKVSEDIKGKEEIARFSLQRHTDNERGAAGRIANIMSNGFSKALGVGCDHCHKPW
ncbi:MAG: hypothetical protein IPH77_15410 [Ignavibacteria bacterium]|nr:hypothetical protein [Ignavibacteria bacterium]